MNGTVVTAWIASFLLQLGFSVIGWIRIPDGAQVAIRWGLGGNPNGFAPKPVALLIIPVVTILIGWILVARSAGASSAPALFGFAVLAGAHGLIVFSAIK